MKEEIIKEVAGMTKEVILKSIDVLQREIPDLIHQIYTWEITIGAISFLLGIIPLIIALKLYMSLRKKWEKFSEEDCIPWVIGIAVFTILGGIVTIGSFVKVLEISIAPKLYLANYIYDLIR